MPKKKKRRKGSSIKVSERIDQSPPSEVSDNDIIVPPGVLSEIMIMY